MGLLLTLILTASCFLIWKSWRARDEVILFIDAPDPDNAAAAVALWRHILDGGKRGHLHIVLTGRPVNLCTSKRFQDSTPVSDQIRRQAWETEVPEHAERLLEDSAERLSNYLHKCRVPDDAFSIYHGGVASQAPLSDVAHDWDFLFDRRDLATGREEDQGEIVEPEEYEALVSGLCSLTEEERRVEILSLLRLYPLVPLEELRSLVTRRGCGGIHVFLGGPATALLELFSGKGGGIQRRKVKRLFAMFGSLQPGKKTLLPNQFNAACDLEAAREVFCSDSIFSHVDKFLVTTETCKHSSLVASAAELERIGVNPYVVRLQRLWEVTHSDVPQPLFDIVPVMAALPEYGDKFSWVRKRAELQRQSGASSMDVFRFVDCEFGTLYASEEEVRLDRQAFLQFLAHTWTV